MAISQVQWKPGDSHFWAGLMATKKYFFPYGSFSIKDGSEIRFWEDKWLDNATLREQYPALYNIVRHKGDTLAKVLESFPPVMDFRRDLNGPRLASWNELLQRLASVHLSQGPDEFRWSLTKNKKFSVDSMYKALIQPTQPILDNKSIWKMKIPLKTKVFAWYLRRGVILTKDNLAKRNWHGCKKCVFCHQHETIKHLFFQCQFVRSIWSIIQIGSSLYPPRSVANIFGNWLNGVDHRFKILIKVGGLPLFGRSGYVGMTRFLMIKILLLCRSFTGLRLCSAHGRLFSVRRTKTCLWRCLLGWKIRRRSLLSNMGGSIA